ncbi:MAG: M16 family metallopeptidase [Planctomycetota bacterium]
MGAPRAASLLVKGGASLDPPGKAGVCRLTADMLDEGAAELGALEFTSAMERLGASFTVATGRESVRVNLQALTSKLEPALALCADAVLRPRFDDGEWQRVKRLHLEALRQAEDRPSSVARLVGMRAFFGDDHSYGRPIAGSEATVKDLTVKDLVRCYGATFFPGNAKVFIAGDLGAGEAKAALEKAFGAWRDPAGAVPAQTLAEPAPRGPHRVVLVDKPEAVQTVVRFYMPGPSFAHPERSTYKALNTVLGGSFTSRLNQNLREKHGYTYGAASSFVMTPRSGYFVAAASVQAKHTAASIREFLAELDSIRTGNVTEEEAGKARATNRQEVVQSLQGLRGLLEAAITLELGGLPFAALGSYMEAVEKVSAADINELGKRAIPLEHAVLVLVGSKRTILAQIGELQLPTPVELSVHGEPVSR